MRTALEIKNLTFGYGRTRLFQGLNLSFAEGEFTAILGRNGAGKTSLLRVIAGIIPSCGDSVEVFGKAVSSIPPRERAKLIAFVPQERTAHIPLTVYDILTLGRVPHLSFFFRLSDYDLNCIQQELQELLLEPLARRKFSELSGGERQRVIIARALVQEPRIILLDEPTANLDLNYQKEIMDKLTSVQLERGLTVLFTMHNVSLAFKYAKRIVLIDKGYVIADASPDEIWASGILSTIYADGISLLDAIGSEVLK